MPVVGCRWPVVGESESFRPPATGHRQRGSVLILAMILVAVLALVATAFIVTARLEGRAAANALRGVQAEAACRSGLAAAMARIGEVYSGAAPAVAIYSSGSWHEFFHDASGPDLCPDEWVAHYDHATPEWEMKAKPWQLPRVEAVDPADGGVKQLKRIRGFAAEYYVAVADLDGKLHGNPWYYDNLFADADRDAKTQAMLTELSLVSADARDALALDKAPNWSLGALRKKLIDKGVPEADYEKNETEKFFTVYPRVATLSKANMGRPAVNVNTARPEVLRAIIINVPDFNVGVLAQSVVDKLIARRPFADRRAMEKALYQLGDPNWPALPVAGYSATDSKLTEIQMNDLLNSLAGPVAAGDSDLDRASAPGVYTFNFSDDADPPTRDSTGDHTVDAAKPLSAEYTWGTEVKFVSRYYHVYVMGRTIADDAERRVLSERRLHAVYDAGLRRVLWARRHFYPKANMSD